MLTCIEGVYREGAVQLMEAPRHVRDNTRVIVTFLRSGPVDLRERGIGEEHAADLRARLSRFAEDWDSPEMEGYDSYDAANSQS